MTNEERNIITQFIARVGGAQGQSGFAGSVPATVQPNLPPVDREADAFIAEQFQRSPEARYRITQLAFVQEQALIEAQSRIKRMEWELQQAQQAAQQAQQEAQQRPSGGFFSGLFGGGRQQSAPPQGGPGSAWGQGGPQQPQQPYYQQGGPPPPQYPPNYQPGVFQRQGSGFLGSALTTAAGVAGGLVAGNALMSLFSGSHGGSGLGAGGFGGAGGGPWSTPTAPSVDTGTWAGGDGAAAPSNQDYIDSGTWDQPAPDSSSWSDNSSSGGGWDSGGGSSGGSSDDDTF